MCLIVLYTYTGVICHINIIYRHRCNIQTKVGQGGHILTLNKNIHSCCGEVTQVEVILFTPISIIRVSKHMLYIHIVGRSTRAVQNGRSKTGGVTSPQYEYIAYVSTSPPHTYPTLALIMLIDVNNITFTCVTSPQHE